MNREWPAFAAIISNLQMSLFKSDMRIALEYSKLCDNEPLAEQVFGMIDNENGSSIKSVLQVAEIDSLLADDPVLKLSLTRRDPYLDPMATCKSTCSRSTVTRPSPSRTACSGRRRC